MSIAPPLETSARTLTRSTRRTPRPSSSTWTFPRTERSKSPTPRSTPGERKLSVPRLLPLAQPPVVLRNRVLISRRNILRRRRPHLPCLRLGRIASQLQLQLVDVVQQLRMQFLHHRRVPREPRRLELLQLLL